MARPFKKQAVRYYSPDGKRCSAGSPGALRREEESRNYYGNVPLPDGSCQQVPLCPDLARSRQMLGKLRGDAAMRRVGLVDKYKEHKDTPLGKHLDAFEQALQAKGNSSDYVKLVMLRLSAVAEGCSWGTLVDLSVSQANEWLGQQSTLPAPALPEDRQDFTPKEAARLLGVSLAAMRAAVKRHRLEATGHGRKRRLPRVTVQKLLDCQSQGPGPATRNYYRAHLRTFGNWLAKDGRLGENPFRHVEMENAEVDRRHNRRELSAEELRRLLEVARHSQRSFRGLNGDDRYHLYATAAGTGFRAKGLASLTPESFDWSGKFPVVTLAARNAKNKKTKEQPLPPDLADLLRPYMTSKAAGQPLWGGTWAKDHRGAEMLRMDLEVAGIPYIVEGPDGPLHADFHSLRHSYLTLGSKSGIDLRTLQELAGHSTSKLTERYSHRRLHDLAGAVEKMPKLTADHPSLKEVGQLKATGTDGKFGCIQVHQHVTISGHSKASQGMAGVEGGVFPETTQPPISAGVVTSSHLVASAVMSEDDGTRTRNHRIDR
jgi:integrase/recombinase XerC